MNKKGQTLIIFVILIPIIIAILALVTDTGIMINRKRKIGEIIDLALKEAYKTHNEEKVMDTLKKNDIKSKNVNYEDNGSYIIIEVNEEIDSVFGKILGINNYKVNEKRKIMLVDGELKITKE